MSTITSPKISQIGSDNFEKFPENFIFLCYPMGKILPLKTMENFKFLKSMDKPSFLIWSSESIISASIISDLGAKNRVKTRKPGIFKIAMLSNGSSARMWGLPFLVVFWAFLSLK